MRAQSLLIAILIFFFAGTVAAEQSSVNIENTKAPKICLVLSGGGARGFAHVGVLKELETLRIPIHCIAGTSMGAVVGGLYAAGLSASEIEERLNKLRLNDIALDRVPRKELPHALREEDTQYPLGATLGLSSTGVRLPTGAVQATQFLELLHNWTAHLKPDIDFDQLPIPFRAVATDLENGKMVLLNKGPLHLAIRASMAAPGVFSPVEIDGRLLTDGGLVRNLPVDIARNMGADIIIAVNIGTHLLKRNELTSLLNVSQQMVNILTEQNVDRQKAGLRPGDILIEPDLGSISFMDFGRYTEASTIGEKSAIALQSTLSGLSVTPERYAAMKNRRPHSELPAIKISFVEIESNGIIPKAEISRQVSIAKGSIYNAEEINQQLALLNISREYDGINHELVQHNGEYGVRINANERKWGPHFLRFGMALSSGYDGTGGFRLHVGHRQPWITDTGLEWRNDLEFGNALGIRTELRQPIFERESIFFAPFADIKRNTRNLFSGENRIAEYNFRRFKVGADIGVPLGERSTLGEFKMGVAVNHYRVNPKLGVLQVTDANGVSKTVELPSGTLQQAGINTSVIVDQLSDATFPRHGYEFDSNLFLGLNGSSNNYKEFAINGTWAESIESHSINFKLSAAGLFQSSKEVRGVGPTLGGFQQLSAFQPDQFTGNYMLYGSATYLYRALKFDLAGQSLFVGSSIEIGNVWSRAHEISFASTRKSASLFAGFNSFMGPIYFGFAVGTAGAKSVFFQLGRQ